RIFTPFAQGFRINQVKIDNRLLGDLQAIASKWLAFHLIGYVTCVIVLAVPGQSQNRSDNQLRRPARTRTFHRPTDYIQTICEIGSIDGVTFEAITDRAVNEIMAGELAII